MISVSTSKSRADWALPAALVALVLIPVVAGASRLLQLARGAEVTPENARFFSAPVPVSLHVVCASLFCVLGALQFAPGFRRRRLDWHRNAGRLLTACGLVAALTGLWMSQFYPLPDSDGALLFSFRILFGSAMVVCLALGFLAARRGDFGQHRAWIARGYAIGLGAGTQALVHLPWIMLFGQPGKLARALLMGAGWVINLAVVEWRLARRA